MKQPLEKRYEAVLAFIEKRISKKITAEILSCTTRTIANYAALVRRQGKEGLRDRRHSNHWKISPEQRERTVLLKSSDRWRSARNVRDELSLPVHETTVWRIFQKAGLIRQNRERIKPIQRFEAAKPNDLWQTDIMGKVDFPKIGTLYLIATLDDHSRFVLSGRWFKAQGKLNVFRIWYEALAGFGLPKAMLQDEGSQYKASARFGQADYQWYAKTLDIDLIYTHNIHKVD